MTIPPQHRARTIDAPLDVILHGTLAGVLGGMFAAFFIISKGASKVVYYVGGFLLFFVPGLHMTLGGMAWMLSTSYSCFTPDVYFLATATALLAGVVAFF